MDDSLNLKPPSGHKGKPRTGPRIEVGRDRLTTSLQEWEQKGASVDGWSGNWIISGFRDEMPYMKLCELNAARRRVDKASQSLVDGTARRIAKQERAAQIKLVEDKLSQAFDWCNDFQTDDDGNPLKASEVAAMAVRDLLGRLCIEIFDDGGLHLNFSDYDEIELILFPGWGEKSEDSAVDRDGSWIGCLTEWEAPIEVGGVRIITDGG